jgi:superfamily II DNA or RNA helicase
MTFGMWTPAPAYHSDADDLVADFYAPCMREAVAYDRLTGYFSSTAFIITWSELRGFISRGGRIRLICSPAVSESDATNMVTGYRARTDEELTAALQAELERLVGIPHLRNQGLALAAMIAADVIDIRLAEVESGAPGPVQQMFHDKVGLFSDGAGNAIGFRGSANETLRGLSARDGNIESIDAWPSWGGDRDEARVSNARVRFDRLWKNEVHGVRVRPIPANFKGAAHAIAGNTGWATHVAIIEQEELAAAQSSIQMTPSGKPLRPQQARALDAWLANDRRGIFAHATGSGKTLTGLTAISNHVGPGAPVLVIVPRKLLLEQWYVEALAELGPAGVKVHRCGGGHNAWKNNLRDLVTDETQARVIIAIANTASSPAFLKHISHATNLLIVGDEVHWLGAQKLRAILTVDADARLGLSATPTRAGDPEGTAQINEYFGGVVDRFTLQDAIEANVLTPYEYHPHIITLTLDEQHAWDRITLRIKRLAGMVAGNGHVGQSTIDQLKTLLIQRSRIVKKAADKPAAARTILRTEYRPGDRWLVYCDDIDQLDEVARELRAEGLPVAVYHSTMAGDKENTLASFALNGGIVVSIKCLDEGVDIPSADRGLILASSRNEREHVQRRGRLLRKAEGKYLAVIHDVLVKPAGDLDTDGENMLWGEIARAGEFAKGAVNTTRLQPLEAVCLELGIDLARLYLRLDQINGFEDDEADE